MLADTSEYSQVQEMLYSGRKTERLICKLRKLIKRTTKETPRRTFEVKVYSGDSNQSRYAF